MHHFRIAGFALAGLLATAAVAEAKPPTRTCRGVFITGPGSTGSTLGDCRFLSDSSAQVELQRVCVEDGRCSAIITERPGRGGPVLVVISASREEAEVGGDAEAAKRVVREVLSRVFSTTLNVTDKMGDDKRFMTPSLYALFKKNAEGFDADPYTGSQEPGSYKLLSLETEETKAGDRVDVIADYEVATDPKSKQRIVYELVQVGQSWRIDDIRYVTDKMTMRGLLAPKSKRGVR